MKAKTNYICRDCGYETPKWLGRCPGCGAWNSFEEQVTAPSVSASSSRPVLAPAKIQTIREIDLEEEVRFATGFSELDRVLGGGLVKGSLVLLGGDPGIGKSTLLLQICQTLGQKMEVLYLSGEESPRQIRLRADRLGVDAPGLKLACATDVEQILELIRTTRPQVVMVDSIQTMSLSRFSSAPGSVQQVRECTNAFLRLAKEEDIPILLVGHVNKDGAIAGPKVLEHIVDAVLHFEGDRNLNFRILRSIKNRFGSTNEIGVFRMEEEGLEQVENPSAALLEGRPEGESGSCVVCVMEGSRPILVEVQALVSKTVFQMPRRSASGFDYNRLYLLLAVLEKRCGYRMSSLDAYVNVVGGLRLEEPSADLSVCLALLSGLLDKPIPADLLALGEVGLTGEVRGVTRLEQRISEARRLGFTRCIVSAHSLKQLKRTPSGMEVVGGRTPQQAAKAAFAGGDTRSS